MEASGVLFARTRGDIAVLTRSLSGEEFNIVGLYWERDGGHEFLAVDLSRGILRLPRHAACDDVVLTANDLGPAAAFVTTVEELARHRDVERLACWPFHHPNNDRVIEVAYRWISDLGPPSSFHDYIAHPRTLMDFLPRLREKGLVLDPRHEFPGVILQNAEVEEDVAMSGCECYGGARSCEAIRLLELGDLRVVQNSVRHHCRGCGVLEELAEAVSDGVNLLGHDFTRRVLGWRCSENDTRGSLCFIRDEVREDLASMIRGVLDSLGSGDERPTIAMDVLLRVADAIGARVDAEPRHLGSPPASGSSPVIDREAPRSRPLTVSATLALPGEMSSVPEVSTPSVLHLPLLASRADVAALDVGQLAEVAAFLSQRAMLRDERASHLRALVDEEMRVRASAEKRHANGR